MYVFLISLSGKYSLILENGLIQGIGDPRWKYNKASSVPRKTPITQIMELSAYWTIVKDFNEHGR